MILASFQAADGSVRIAAVRRDRASLIDLQAAHIAQRGDANPAFADMIALMEGGDAAMDRARALEALHADTVIGDTVIGKGAAVLALADVRLLAPVPRPTQMRDFSVFEQHMKQAGAAIARMRAERTGDSGPLPSPADIRLPPVFYTQPLYYKANRMNVVGTGAEVRWPSYCEKMDFELEFGVFIGRAGRNILGADARRHIFGYTIFNDFYARDAQELEMSGPFGPCKGKDFDSGNAMGPWIVTPDELPDPYALTMIARVNGEEWCRNTSAGMIHSFETMIAHASRDETLYPGEFLGSGTVGGGSGLEIGRWLQPGDVVELEVEGIGVLRNRVIGPTR